MQTLIYICMGLSTASWFLALLVWLWLLFGDDDEDPESEFDSAHDFYLEA